MNINPWRSSFIRIALEGRSFIDAKRIHIHTLEEAERFIESYGYDINDTVDQQELIALKQEAIELIEEELLLEGEEIPEAIKQETDIRQYLLQASRPRHRASALWSAAMLRVLHTLTHSHSHLNDLYHHEIRVQIFSRYQPHIHYEMDGMCFGDIPLVHFEMRPQKTRRSVAMKLMHKTEHVAADIFDWIGLRFVTKKRADALDLLAYLRNHHIVAFANIKPSRTRNTLIDFNWVIKQLNKGDSVESIRLAMDKKQFPTSEQISSDNPYSNTAYHSIQLTCRQRIKVNAEQGEKFSFFFPYEIQLMDEQSFHSSREGLASHEEYKKRQRAAVRQRILPFLR